MVCPVCDGDSFHILVVLGTYTHKHFQCANPICAEIVCDTDCSKCKKCATPLKEDGLCGDETCPCSDPHETCNYCGSAMFDDRQDCAKCGL